MIYLKLKIEESKGRLYIYDESECVDATEEEEKKWRLFFNAIRDAAVAEAKRLADLGRRKTMIGSEAAKNLNLRPEDAPEAFIQMPPAFEK